MTINGRVYTVREMAETFHRVFGTDDGQAVLQYLRTKAFYYAPTISADPGIMQFNEGQRSLVLMIDSMLRPIENIQQGDDNA